MTRRDFTPRGWMAFPLVVAVACSGPEDGPAAAPEWSIETAEVLFTARRGGVSDLYILDRGTGDTTRLTSFGTPDGGANAARVSPEGQRIAFQIRRGQDYEVHVVDLAGGPSTNLSTHPEYDVNPVWSPDGESVAFMSTRGFALGSIGPFPGHVYTRALAADTVMQVTREPLTSSYGPSDWSPDGTTLLIARDDEVGTNLYRLEVDTGRELRLTARAGANYSATYDHSGDRVAFHSEWAGSSQIVVLDLRTMETRVVTSGPGLRYSPRWSPDDEWLMFTASDDGSDYDVRAVRIADGYEIDIVATDEDEREGGWLPPG